MKLRAITTAIIFGLAATPAFADSRSIEQKVGDARLEGQIATAILFNRHLNPFEISVDVASGTAVLTGTVDEEIDKELAQRVALNAKGIERVDNRIKVDPKWQPKEDNDRDFDEAVRDATITASVKSRLLWNEMTDGLDINVDTHNGRVTMTGSASNADEVKTATQLAQNTDGVVAVDNRIVVTKTPGKNPRTASEQPVEDSWITTKVKASLLMSKNVDGLDLTVETKNGMVYLGGAASSKAERDLAAEIADDVRGVRGVDTSAVKIGV